MSASSGFRYLHCYEGKANPLQKKHLWVFILIHVRPVQAEKLVYLDPLFKS